MNTTEKDPFYETDLPVETEEFDLDEILSRKVEEELEEEEDQPDENWEITEEEEKILQRLLEKKRREDEIMKAYLALENKPSEEVIAKWKAEFGDIYLVSLSEKENFIFRGLKRGEWRHLTAQIKDIPKLKKEEAIAIRGTLFPRLNEQNIAVLTGGAPEVITNLILEASNFMSPEKAVSLVRKL